MKRTFPRAKQKAIVKKFQSKARLAKSVDLMIFLDYMMFLRSLATESNIKAGEEKSKTIQQHHVKDVLKESRRFMENDLKLQFQLTVVEVSCEDSGRH